MIWYDMMWYVIEYDVICDKIWYDMICDRIINNRMWWDREKYLKISVLKEAEKETQKEDMEEMEGRIKEKLASPCLPCVP